jgi:hypothetical protein
MFDEIEIKSWYAHRELGGVVARRLLRLRNLEASLATSSDGDDLKVTLRLASRDGKARVRTVISRFDAAT